MTKKYCEKYDVYYNDINGHLIENRCSDKDCEYSSDKDCEYCKDRPEQLLKAFCSDCKFKLIDGTICEGMNNESN